MIAIQSSALAAQSLGCLAPSSRHLCSTGPGTESSSVRSVIFWIGRKMSLLAELVSHLTGLRLSGKSGQIKVTWLESNQNQTDLNRKSGSSTCGQQWYALVANGSQFQPSAKKHFKPSSQPKTLNLLGKSAKHALKNTSKIL